MEADGWSLDDKRKPLLPEDKLRVIPTAEEHAKDNLPDILTCCRSISNPKSEFSNLKCRACEAPHSTVFLRAKPTSPQTAAFRS